MSGIIGFISKTKNKQKTGENMLNKIIHRGPKEQFFYHDKNIALAQCSLNNYDGTNKDLILLLDGTILNKDELGKTLKIKKPTDKDIIIKGFKKWQFDLPKYLRGNFAFVLWDKKKKILYGARDHFGVKPLYYSNNKSFIFASEIKAILSYPKFKKEFNKELLKPFLTFNFNPCDETFFKGIFTLNPGHYFVYQNDELTISKYYNYQFKEENLEKEQFTKLIHETISDSVNKNIKEQENFGSFLSSGIDSSYLVSLSKPKKAFTVGYEEQKYNEIKYAKELADKLNIEHLTSIISKEDYLNIVPKIMNHFDEPIADPAAIALYFGMEKAIEEVDMIISGEGADEFFAGYGIYQDLLKLPLYSKIPFFLRRIISKIVSLLPEFKGSYFFIRRGLKIEEWYIGGNYTFTEKESKKYLNIESNISNSSITNKIYDNFKEENDLNKMQALDIHLFLPKNYLANNDKLANMFALDVRTPFTDILVSNVASILPYKYKISKTTSKIALREATKTILPEEIYKRKKLGFPVPLRDWMKEDLFYNKIKDTFNTDVAKELFNHKKIIKLLDDHRNNKEDVFKKVWLIYIFLIWYQEFFSS